MQRKKFILTESELNRIVSESIKKVLKEHGISNFYLENYSEIKIEFIGRERIKQYSELLWNMLTDSYANIGGLKTYRSREHFNSMAKYAKIASIEDNIVACAIYRNMEDNYKLVAIGCNQENDGKRGIQAIVQDDIKQMDYHFWAEVSGAIEHYFKKYNGYPMPNVLASEILNIDEDSLRMSSTDNVHYERIISNEWFEKMIFGIKSEEIYNKAIAAVEDYSKFMKSVNNINENAISGLKYSLKQAFYIAENIIRAHEEDDFNELIPSWYDALQEAIKTFKASKQTQSVIDYIEYCEYLLKTMPVLKLEKLNIQKS